MRRWEHYCDLFSSLNLTGDPRNLNCLEITAFVRVETVYGSWLLDTMHIYIHIYVKKMWKQSCDNTSMTEDASKEPIYDMNSDVAVA